MDKIDHIALQTENVKSSIEWFQKRFDCKITYEDDSWAMLEFKNIKLALVLPNQHPPHVAISCDDIEKHGTPKKHRDGSEYIYIKDKEENVFELIRYPDKN